MTSSSGTDLALVCFCLIIAFHTALSKTYHSFCHRLNGHQTLCSSWQTALFILCSVCHVMDPKPSHNSKTWFWTSSLDGRTPDSICGVSSLFLDSRHPLHTVLWGPPGWFLVVNFTVHGLKLFSEFSLPWYPVTVLVWCVVLPKVYPSIA